MCALFGAKERKEGKEGEGFCDAYRQPSPTRSPTDHVTNPVSACPTRGHTDIGGGSDQRQLRSQRLPS